MAKLSQTPGAIRQRHCRERRKLVREGATVLDKFVLKPSILERMCTDLWTDENSDDDEIHDALSDLLDCWERGTLTTLK